MRLFIFSVLFLSLSTQAQTGPGQGSALRVEQSVPFGTTTGQLLVLPDYLVFVNGQQIESSYVLPSTNIDSLTAESGTVTIQTVQPVRDRSGETSRITYRVLGGDISALSAWQAARTADRVASTGTPASSSPEMYEATHEHLFGACHGRLMIENGQLSYESIDNVDHSRRWAYASVRELSQPNPYQIQIKPAMGDDYKLKLGGSGMEPSAYNKIVERVTSARAGTR